MLEAVVGYVLWATMLEAVVGVRTIDNDARSSSGVRTVRSDPLGLVDAGRNLHEDGELVGFDDRVGVDVVEVGVRVHEGLLLPTPALSVGGKGDRYTIVVVVVGGRMASHGPKSMCEHQNSPWV